MRGLPKTNTGTRGARPKLPKSRLDLREIAAYGTYRILHANRIGRGGLVLNRNPTELEPEQLARCNDMFHYEDTLRTWPGDSAKGSVFGSTAVMGIFNVFQNIAGTDVENLFLDTTLARRWDSGTPDWEIEFELYTKGDIDQTTNGGTAVVGNAGTDWATRDTTTGTRINSGEGAEFKLDADPDTDWTEIATVGSDTALTLVAGGYLGSSVGPAATAAYTIRKRFRGTTSDFFAAVEFEGDLYFSQGIDSLRKYDVSATPRITAVADAATPANVPAAGVLETFADRIFAAKLADYAAATPTLQMIAWCAERDATDWTGTGSSFRTFIETPGAVQTLKRMDENLVLYKEFDIWFGVRTGQAQPPVFWEPKITSARHGCLAYRSVVPIEGAGHLYLGQDNFYMLQPFRSVPIGELAIRDFVMEQIPKELAFRVQGILLDQYRMVGFLIPTGAATSAAMLLYDYYHDAWYGPIWQSTPRLETYLGHFYEPSGNAFTYGDLVGTYGAQTWRYGERVGGAGGKSILIGNGDGEITEVTESVTTFDGAPRDPVFTTAAVYPKAPMEEALATRVTITYKVPSLAIGLSVELSDDGFLSVLAQRVVGIAPTDIGATNKAYADFIVAAERLQARVSAVGPVATRQLEVYEVAIEVTGAGIETDTS